MSGGTRGGPAAGAVARAAELLPRRADWARARVGRDLTAGVMVALVALPLALGFGVSSGVGAGAGIVTAIVAGVVAAVFGGSHVQVSGPTGAMTVVLIPIVAAHGTDGVLVVGLLAGLMLIGLSLTGAGRAIRYVPVPVIEGFTAGIAMIIALQQLPAAVGVDVHAEKILVLAAEAVRAAIAEPSWPAPLAAFGSAAAIVLSGRLRPGFPAALLLVGVVTVANAALDIGLDTIGRIPSGLPAPSVPSVPWADLDTLLLAAIAVTALGALELAEVSRVRVVVLRMSHVTTVDATGAHVLADTIGGLERRGVTVLLSGVQPQHTQVLSRLGVHSRLAHERHLFDTTPDAIAHARLHAARIRHSPEAAS